MKYAFFLSFLFILVPGQAQNKSDLPFIEHLINKGLYREVIHTISTGKFNYNKNQNDSLEYFNGWAHYSLKNLEQSTVSFLKVGTESSFYLKSRFFAGYNQIFLGNFDESKRILGELNSSNDGISSLRDFEMGGICMLEGEWSSAKEQFKKVNPEIATVNQQVTALLQICKKEESHHYKSPFLAGVLSAIIPGSGKLYAGKTGEGIATMIATTGLGLISWENFHKLGLNHAKTIVFGSVFAATYISNIYGSVISVKIIENDYQDALHNQILFQLHIPLRNFFEL